MKQKRNQERKIGRTKAKKKEIKQKTKKARKENKTKYARLQKANMKNAR